MPSPRLPREGSQFRPVEAFVGAAGPVQRRRRALDAATPPTPGTGVAEALGGVVEGPALSQGTGDGSGLGRKHLCVLVLIEILLFLFVYSLKFGGIQTMK